MLNGIPSHYLTLVNFNEESRGTALEMTLGFLIMELIHWCKLGKLKRQTYISVLMGLAITKLACRRVRFGLKTHYALQLLQISQKQLCWVIQCVSQTALLDSMLTLKSRQNSLCITYSHTSGRQFRTQLAEAFKII